MIGIKILIVKKESECCVIFKKLLEESCAKLSNYVRGVQIEKVDALIFKTSSLGLPDVQGVQVDLHVSRFVRIFKCIVFFRT